MQRTEFNKVDIVYIVCVRGFHLLEEKDTYTESHNPGDKSYAENSNKGCSKLGKSAPNF